MKFIADHNETRNSLQIWAGAKKLTIAAHYFWTPGTEIQRSYEGLLRSLSFVPYDGLPPLWGTPPVTRNGAFEILGDVLSTVAHQPDAPARYCFFVDGLDEYDGDHFEVCKILQDLAMSPNVKCCLSSRPWNVFSDAFGIDLTRKLYVHALTRQDISAYAQSELSGHYRWSEACISTAEMQEVVDSITGRAHGVFLWVFLVTRSLRDGLVNGNTITDLKERLGTFPNDLEPFFKHMLDAVDTFYYRSMARILRLAVNAKQSLKVEFYHVQEYEMKDKEYALCKSTKLHSTEMLSSKLDQCRRRINARCGGLLEVKDGRVEFLHRTVRDFLRTREMDDYLRDKAGTDFKPNLSTLKGFIFLFRCWLGRAKQIELSDDESFWRECLTYANAAIDESAEDAVRHLDAVQGLYDDIAGSGTMHADLLNVPVGFAFRYELVRAGVHKYVAAKLRQETISFFDNILESPLYTALRQPQWSSDHTKTAAQLLEAGIDANGYESEQPWHLFIHLACAPEDGSNLRMALQSCLFSLFLEHGAERDKPVSLRYLDGEADAELAQALQRRGTRDLLPCTHFLDAIFHHECAQQFSNQSLRVIESFLDCAEEIAKLQLGELVAALVSNLDRLALAARSTAPGRLRFFYRIAHKIIAKGVQLDAGLDALIHPSATLLKSAGGGHLVKMIRDKSVSAYSSPACTPSKRRRECFAPSPPHMREREGEGISRR
ncbi:hypothetical protein V8F33_013795 [Rhypophila sp. PSN 637]